MTLLTILGPTASGKTALAAHVAHAIGGEIISADSRQVYREMNIGTGKDYDDYIVEGQKIPYHLIDIAEPGSEYNIYLYQSDFLAAYQDICSRKRLPILCGGSGMYLEAILKGYRLTPAAPNHAYRQQLENKSDDELMEIILSFKKPHNSTDFVSRERMIRAVEIGKQNAHVVPGSDTFPKIESKVFGIRLERAQTCDRIMQRLGIRLKNGMIEEVSSLLKKGLTPAQLKFYGLEYKYLVMYLENELSYDEMFRQLNIAIRQFAKRQMTWFRRLERSGVEIKWIDGSLSDEEKTNLVLKEFR